MIGKIIFITFFYYYILVMKRETLIKKYAHILDEIIKETIKHKIGRKNKYDNFVYLNYIFRVFFYGENWCNIVITHKIDISTIRKKFYLWRDNDIFKKAFEKMFLLYSKNRTFKQLFIDSTCIQNMNCSSEICKYYCKIKSKKQIKLSIICDNNNVPVSHEIHNPQIHDSKMIKPLIKKLEVNLKKNSNLIGDKGYITKQRKYMRKGKSIKLIVEPRKNQKKTMSNKDKKIYKLRYKVEQTFSHLKRSYKRINVVTDRKIINYETFIIMAITCQFIRKM